ncbi:hypothetical protein [Flavisolibacter tropicus]|uniref:Uncharacterized protein n=1 Tax=Flavisolibacter tropicus TaxID=1492898 RepID=A0A172TVA8_9BACT|nr:hypothetical protein [Flavisolibacter tropicus]ANE50932.1 hypothetical protein SY85_10885 [Flavisolibacter tropicus]
MDLKKEEFWNCIVGAETFATYCTKVVPMLTLKDEVPDEVQKSFAIIRKLLIHAYYEYDFLDPAMAKALTTFEMALKVKYKEIGETRRHHNLQSLMYWFNDNGFFEFDRKGLLDALRSMRNNFSHPEKHFGGGFGIMNIFDHCVGMINDLYEDRELRNARVQKRKEINASLKEIVGNGGFVIFGEIKYIIYSAEVLFIDNVNTPSTYHFFYKTIFKLETDSGKDDSLPFATLLEATNVKMDVSKKTIIFERNGGNVLFQAIDDPVNLQRFEKWKDAFDKSNKDQFKDIEVHSQLDKQWARLRNNVHFRNSLSTINPKMIN